MSPQGHHIQELRSVMQEVRSNIQEVCNIMQEVRRDIQEEHCKPSGPSYFWTGKFAFLL